MVLPEYDPARLYSVVLATYFFAMQKTTIFKKALKSLPGRENEGMSHSLAPSPQCTF